MRSTNKQSGPHETLPKDIYVSCSDKHPAAPLPLFPFHNEAGCATQPHVQHGCTDRKDSIHKKIEQCRETQVHLLTDGGARKFFLSVGNQSREVTRGQQPRKRHPHEQLLFRNLYSVLSVAACSAAAVTGWSRRRVCCPVERRYGDQNLLKGFVIIGVSAGSFENDLGDASPALLGACIHAQITLSIQVKSQIQCVP